MRKIIKNSRDLDIRNVNSLPHGTGAKYLEVIRGQKSEFVAKAWKRKLPKKQRGDEIYIELS